MATVALARLLNNQDSGLHTIQWTPLTTTNADGAPIPVHGAKNMAVIARGTFGAGGAVRMEMSADGTNWVPMDDGFGSPVSFSAAGGFSLRAGAAYVRPFVTGGDGTTAITVELSFAF